MNKKFAVGADIGGSHISSVLMDLEEKNIIKDSFSTRHVNKHGAAAEILKEWMLAIEDTLSRAKKHEIAGIGFAMPGPFEYETGIALMDSKVDKYENLYNINVGEQLREMLHLDKSVHFRFINDATAFAIGEAWMGKAAGYKKTIAITLGTGFGSAFLDEGVPVLEREDVPNYGCVWHLPYKNGIADDYFSTRWYIKSYAEKTGITMTGVKEIASKALIDPLARQLFEEFGQNLGEFLGMWIKKFDAECLVIGGNMTGAFDLFGPSFKSSLNDQRINLTINISELMETAAMVGRARLMDENFWLKIKPLLSKM